MYVVDVIPFTPGAPGGSLSYRSRERLSPGDIVMVTLRRRKVPGVVVGLEEARDAKASLKTASFMVSGSISRAVGRVPRGVMQAAREVALWHAAPLGAVLSQLLTPWTSQDLGTLTDAPGSGFLVSSVECPFTERRARYRTAIAANQKRNRATLLVVPTVAEVEYWKKALADLSPRILSGAQSEKKRTLALSDARTSDSLIITTPYFAFAQIEQLETVIIDRVGAGGFRLPKRPYIDIRIALLALARARSFELIQGDFPLPLEYRKGGRRSSAGSLLIDVLDTSGERAEGESWMAVPLALRKRIAEEVETGGRVAVFATRKGYAPVVVCGDCGHSLKDDRGRVYTFASEQGRRLFRTADGRSELSTKRNCPVCNSWNLLPLGVGVERVFEELKECFADSEVILFDADAVRSVVGAKKKLSQLSEPGSIVIGTEAMAPWLLAVSPAPLTLTVIASADSLLALPFWRARERFLRLALFVRALAPHAVIATRLPDDAAVKSLLNPIDPVFFEEEESLRRVLHYPPFGTLVALTSQGSLSFLDRVEDQIRAATNPHTLLKVSDRSVRGNVSQRTLVLQLPENAWPNQELTERLSELPPSVRVMVDPESFW